MMLAAFDIMAALKMFWTGTGAELIPPIETIL
jgi:hypothetical protein